MEPARLFVEGNHEIKSREGTTQGDPTAMGVTSVTHFLNEFNFINEHRSTEVTFADDFSCRKSKQDQSILRCTTTTAFVWLLPQTIQIISDCERTVL